MVNPNRITQRNPGWLKKLRQQYEGSEVLAVGFPVGTDGASASYPDGTRLLMVAAVNNFGSLDGHIPRRPFMELGADKTHEATAPLLRALIPKVNAGQMSKAEALKILGPVAVGQHQAAIVELRQPPNAESTVDAKQSDNPLIDTGLMRQAVTFTVREGE
jgi:hypothetical protein